MQYGLRLTDKTFPRHSRLSPSSITFRAWTLCAVRHPSLPQTKQRTVLDLLFFFFSTFEVFHRSFDIKLPAKKKRKKANQRELSLARVPPVSNVDKHPFLVKSCALCDTTSHARTTKHHLLRYTSRPFSPKRGTHKRSSASPLSPPQGSSEHPFVPRKFPKFLPVSGLSLCALTLSDLPPVSS